MKKFLLLTLLLITGSLSAQSFDNLFKINASVKPGDTEVRVRYANGKSFEAAAHMKEEGLTIVQLGGLGDAWEVFNIVSAMNDGGDTVITLSEPIMLDYAKDTPFTFLYKDVISLVISEGANNEWAFYFTNDLCKSLPTRGWYIIDTLTKWSEFYSAKIVSKTQNSGSCYFTVIDSELDDSTADRLSKEEAWLGSSNIEARLGSQPMNR